MQLFGTILAICVLLLQQNIPVTGLRNVYDRIYEEITDLVSCFRLLNATSQIGCSASPSNVSGVLLYAKYQDDVTAVLTDRRQSPYIIILEPELFTSNNVLAIKHSGNVNGIVTQYIKQNTTIPSELLEFSPAKHCPNEGFGPNDNECKNWNTNGSSLTFTDFEKFGIFALTSNDSFQRLIKCYQDYNVDLTGGYGDYPLCSAQLRADMKAVLSTPECYERGKVWTNLGINPCDPLGDQNVWGTLFELKNPQKIIMVATKLDSSALFPYLSYGANNGMAGVVTQLAVAKALGDMKRNGTLNSTNDAIMFVFFQGESWDYIGSSRMVYDMLGQTFPYERDSSKTQPPLLNLTNISVILELSQVGILSNHSDTESPVYFLHSNDPGMNHTLHSTLVNQNYTTFQKTSSSSNGKTQLPPASAQMFLRENEAVPVIIIADYNDTYNNKFFGSRYDVLENLIGPDTNVDSDHFVVTQLTQLANAIVKSLLEVAGHDGNRDIVEADPELIANLLKCFLQETDCSLFRSSLNPDLISSLNSEPLSRYVTVNTVTNLETQITYQLLANFTGIVNPNITSCGSCSTSDNNQVYSMTGLSGNATHPDSSHCVCVKSFTHYHEATSPAFLLKDYSSTRYSTWVESQWSGIGMRIYLVTFDLMEVGFFFCGLLIFLVSLLVSLQCYRKGRLIFALSAIDTHQ